MRIPENSFLRTTPIAHRGLHDIKKGIPENSYAAYQAAIDEKYRFFSFGDSMFIE